jgi:hypothetical protein
LIKNIVKNGKKRSKIVNNWLKMSSKMGYHGRTMQWFKICQNLLKSGEKLVETLLKVDKKWSILVDFGQKWSI